MGVRRMGELGRGRPKAGNNGTIPYTTNAVMAGNNHRGQSGQSGEGEVVLHIKGGLTVKVIMSGSFLVVT